VGAAMVTDVFISWDKGNSLCFTVYYSNKPEKPICVSPHYWLNGWNCIEENLYSKLTDDEDKYSTVFHAFISYLMWCNFLREKEIPGKRLLLPESNISSHQ